MACWQMAHREFPDLVQGEWICRGWFINEGAHAEKGAWVVTTQFYNFGEELGDATLVTDGIELAEFNVPVARAITGGTGPYNTARGEGVNLSFEINLEGVSVDS